jgi:hypothetical protein
MNDGQARPAAFCIVANVTDQTAHDRSGTEIHRGAEHFPPGAKVRVLPPQWGDGGDQVIVAGQHRGTRGRCLARIIIPRRHLTRFRVQALSSPALISALTRPLAELGWDSPPGSGRHDSKPSRSPRSGSTGQQPANSEQPSARPCRPRRQRR